MAITEKAVVAVDDDEQEEAARVAYARAVGSRLRAMRKQMRLSLQAVEAMSDQEFKASVLGAYERGERAISVPRLQRLAKLYDVPVDQLLPSDDVAGLGRHGSERPGGKCHFGKPVDAAHAHVLEELGTRHPPAVIGVGEHGRLRRHSK